LQEAPPQELLADLAVVRARVDFQLEGVDRVLAVMSGKGGVGKTAVAVNLAQALAARGLRIGLLDADLHSPSVAKMLGMRGQPLRMSGTELLPLEAPGGLAVQSMDFFLQGGQPVAWEGPQGEGAHLLSAVEDGALSDLLGQTRWGALDALVIDLAPGSERLPALARVTGRLSGALAVTIPTEVSLLAVERSVRRAHEARVPLLGLVENMGTTVCPHCQREAPLYSEIDLADRAGWLDLELLARVPFDVRLAAAADRGEAFGSGESAGSPAAAAFAKLAERVAAWTPPPGEGDAW
jgi:ATP-binding protein involved in chromosome partitioning